MKKLNLRQKAVLAEFLANFALAWLTFGGISPFLTGIEDFNIFLIKLAVSILIAAFLLKLALDMLK